MIRSKYLQGKEIPVFDVRVSLAIDNYQIDGGGKTMVIGVQNLQGEIYRVIRATGLGAYISITSDLAEIGLEDELKDSQFGKNGYDSLFVIPEELKNEIANSTHIEPPSLLDDLQSAELIQSTERNDIVNSRIGQGVFRKSLIEYWKGCAVTDCCFAPMLIASHIKPWRDSNDQERLDLYNGFLLAPNLDMAFDSGYISFDSKGKIIISSAFKAVDSYSLRITPKLKIKQKLLTDKHREYLSFHRENVLING
ncbi:HNH endonuclease [Endozoicomonas sp. GU-1]|uniref:HNH endonuclease n=1 Tax=Endozoicomonas sp. GU-1 TaxID=3009078 RepID=UPI0022B4A5F0|nr:HNH endonuclease [Endozoicomonas sp. GU-1]WBA81927.1 HNH endonuclease [Endozoicomonas sp. GU-1]WBA84878.1 HNH endonuclease [Endozoicomonas sp. GU-1]